MSWAANRVTTRAEDIAYCLFGLFDVNLPLLYGEGGIKAFMRLQEEIMKATNDLTIFAWLPTAEEKAQILAPHPTGFYNFGRAFQSYGVIARSPINFRGAGDIVNINPCSDNPEFIITNKGIRIKSELHPVDEDVFMLLNCHHHERLNGRGLAIRLYPKNGSYFRVETEEFCPVVSGRGMVQKVFLSKNWFRYGD